MKARLQIADADVRPQPAKALSPIDSAPSVTLTRAELRELVRSEVIEGLAVFRAGELPPPDLVDGVEMARRIGVSRTTLHRLRVDGMPAIPVGDTFRYRPAAVIAWLESRGDKA